MDLITHKVDELLNHQLPTGPDSHFTSNSTHPPFFVDDHHITAHERNWMADFSACDGSGSCTFEMATGTLKIDKFGKITVSRH